jgi:two-component system probable response regulator PhcQ
MVSPLSARRVLVVDDEEHVCSALRRTLSREGYQVEAYTSAAEALEAMRAAPFDLVISDHLMPDMTGLEFLKRARDRHPDVLRIMLTGQADMQTAIDAINHGEVYRFLTKPWDDVELKVCLTLGFEKLDLEREHRALLARARAGGDAATRPAVERDETGAIVIDS